MASDQERFLAKRIQSLEWALDSEKRKNNEAYKNICKKERLIKELTLKTEQDKQALKDMQVIIEDLESSMKVYKNQMQNVETISTYNADRFRKVHRMYLEESGKSEQVKEELRRIRAAGRTGLFVQV